MTLKRMPLAVVIAVCLTVLGCCKGKKVEVDTSAQRTTTVAANQGADLALRSEATTAHVLVLPDTFPAGTQLSLAPLAGDGGLEGKLRSSAFRIRATHGGNPVQPTKPVLLAFETSEAPPAGATLLAYEDAGGKGRAVPSRTVTDEGHHAVYAEVDHFTIFGVGEDGEAQLVPPPVPGWKEWHLKVNGAPQELFGGDNPAWDVKATMELDAVNTTGSLMGDYQGTAVLRIEGKLKKGAIPGGFVRSSGKVGGNAAGPARFTLWAKPWKNRPVKTQRAKGDPDVDVGAWLDGEGSMKVFGNANLDIRVTGPSVSGGHKDSRDLSATGQSYKVRVLISASGTFVQVDGVGVWRGLLVGVPRK